MSSSAEIEDLVAEIRQLTKTKPPVSASTIANLTQLAFKHAKHYKLVVHHVEKFVEKCRAEYKLSGLYVMDSICKASKEKLKNDPYSPRFAKNLPSLIEHALKCPSKDKPKVLRVLSLWKQNELFPASVLEDLGPIVKKYGEGSAPASPSRRSHSDRSRDPSLSPARSPPRKTTPADPLQAFEDNSDDEIVPAPVIVERPRDPRQSMAPAPPPSAVAAPIGHNPAQFQPPFQPPQFQFQPPMQPQGPFHPNVPGNPLSMNRPLTFPTPSQPPQPAKLETPVKESYQFSYGDSDEEDDEDPKPENASHVSIALQTQNVNVNVESQLNAQQVPPNGQSAYPPQGLGLGMAEHHHHHHHHHHPGSQPPHQPGLSAPPAGAPFQNFPGTGFQQQPPPTSNPYQGYPPARPPVAGNQQPPYARAETRPAYFPTRPDGPFIRNNRPQFHQQGPPPPQQQQQQQQSRPVNNQFPPRPMNNQFPPSATPADPPASSGHPLPPGIGPRVPLSFPRPVDRGH